MLLIAGCMLIIASGVMLFLYLRYSKRPRMEVRIESIQLDHLKQGKKQNGAMMPHARVKYNYEGKNYESSVFLKVRGKKEGDWIEVCINPKQASDVKMFAPKMDKISIVFVFLIGVFIVVGSWWIMSILKL